jgi:hypothetical protein
MEEYSVGNEGPQRTVEERELRRSLTSRKVFEALGRLMIFSNTV